MQDMMERDRQNASSTVARERARAAAAERDAESASSQADARGRQLQHDLDNAHSEVNLPIFWLSAPRIKEVSLSHNACMVVQLGACTSLTTFCAVSLNEVQNAQRTC